MPDWIESSEFPVTEDELLEIRREAVARGWQAREGTLFAGATVSASLRVGGDVLGCRFERDEDLVGLHVYADPEHPVASLTINSTRSAGCMEFVRIVENVSGRSVEVR